MNPTSVCACACARVFVFFYFYTSAPCDGTVSTVLCSVGKQFLHNGLGKVFGEYNLILTFPPDVSDQTDHQDE